MKQYPITIKVNDREMYCGSVFGDKFEIKSLSERSKMIRILKNNDIVYNMVADNIEVIESEGKINVIISDRCIYFKGE